MLDFAAGIAMCSTGHCHPEIVRAIDEQAHKLIHLSGTDFYYLPQIDLAEQIVGLVPGKFKKRVFFANSGTAPALKTIALLQGRLIENARQSGNTCWGVSTRCSARIRVSATCVVAA